MSNTKMLWFKLQKRGFILDPDGGQRIIKLHRHCAGWCNKKCNIFVQRSEKTGW